MITFAGIPNSGNIEVLDESSPDHISLNIRKDNKDPRYQWFNFHLEGEPGLDHVLHIKNAGDATYPNWNEFGLSYQATASYDGQN